MPESPCGLNALQLDFLEEVEEALSKKKIIEEDHYGFK